MTTFRKRVEDLCSRVSYKREHDRPGWHFHVTSSWDHPEVVWVRVGTHVEDSYRIEPELLPFGRVIRFTPADSDDIMLRELFIMVLCLEDHEVHEFFKVDGRPLFSPHDTKSWPHLDFDVRLSQMQAREAALHTRPDDPTS